MLGDVTVADDPAAAPGDRRAELLRVAREVFGERGYGATTTRELGSRLGLPPASLYHYMDSKQELLAEVIDLLLRSMRDVLREGLDATASSERLTRLARAHVQMVVRDPVAVKLVLTEAGALDPERRVAVLDELRQYRLGLQSIIEDGQNRGELDIAVSALMATHFVLGALNWSSRWVDPNGQLGVSAVADALVDVLLHGALVPTVRGTRLSAIERSALLKPRTVRGPTHAAAATLFRQRGYETVTMADLAAALDIPKASLYRRVRNKQGLLYGILDRTWSTCVEMVEELLAHEGPAAARLHAAFELHVVHQVGDLDGTGLALYAQRALDDDQRGRVNELGRRYGAAWRALFEAAVAEGTARPGLRPSLAAATALGTLNWLHRWYRPDGALPPRAVATAASEAILFGLGAQGRR